MKKIITFITIFSLTILPVKAACSYKEKADANKKAANVKVDYEIVEDKQEYEEGVSINEYFKFSILNVTEELYIVVTNDVTDDTYTFTYNNVKDGVINFDWYNNEEVTNFTFKIYATDKTPCQDEELKTIRKQTPKYNDFYNRAICADIKDFYLCQKYTTVKNIDESMFSEKIDNFMAGDITSQGEKVEENKNKNKFLEFLKNYKWYFVGGLLVIVVSTGVVIIVKRRGREVK